MKILFATLIGFIVGISGTLAGGSVIISQKRETQTKQGWLLGFSGGIMVAVTIFDLWPEAWSFGGFWPTFVGTGTGILLVNIFDPLLQLMPWYRRKNYSRLTKVGILLGMGIGVHNFPEGVALGTTFIANPVLSGWLGLALLMAIHNIPEGMVMASAFRIGKVSLLKTISALILVELPMAFGSTLGAFLGQISAQMISLSLGFAGGAMFFLVVKELLPASRQSSGFLGMVLGLGAGFMVGVVLANMIR